MVLVLPVLPVPIRGSLLLLTSVFHYFLLKSMACLRAWSWDKFYFLFTVFPVLITALHILTSCHVPFVSDPDTPAKALRTWSTLFCLCLGTKHQ